MKTIFNKTENFINLNQINKMKTRLNILCKLVMLFLLFASTAFSQSPVPCTPATVTINPGVGNSVFIKGGLGVLNSICLVNTTAPLNGVIYKGGNRFLHNFGTNNTFLGVILVIYYPL